MRDAPGSASKASVTLQILPVVLFTFFCYLSIGLQMAVLPGYVHNQLGYSTVVTGLAISMQSIATLLSRSHAGGMSDTIGPKRAVLLGQGASAISGVLLLMAYAFERSVGFSLGVLFASRFLLGVSESLVATSGMTWGMGRVGHEHTARVISWNGVATFSGLSLGAPLGVKLAQGLSFGAIGAGVVGLALLGMAIAWPRADVVIHGGVRLSFRSVAARVFPHGLGLGLGTVGLGALTSFVTLYYDSRHWDGAALALTVFGCAFIFVRLVSGNAIGRFGGFAVGRISLAVEALGLFMLWLAPSAEVALAAAALTGFGFSLVFPALGVEAVSRVPPGSRGAALGVYSVFFDVALAVVGPAAGYISMGFGFSAIYFAAAWAVVLAVLLVEALRRGWLGK